MNANKQDAGGLPNELGFEQWYVTNTFDYPSNPLGSRDCSIARKAWHAALDAIRNGEQCRAASVASDDAIGVLEMIVDGRISGRISEWPQIKPAISEVLRALSRGAPEDTKDAQRFRDLCELVQAGEWALCEVEITDKHGTVKENWQDGLSDIPQFCDTWASRAASWRKVRTESEQKAAIAAQRKEGV